MESLKARILIEPGGGEAIEEYIEKQPQSARQIRSALAELMDDGKLDAAPGHPEGLVGVRVRVKPSLNAH